MCCFLSCWCNLSNLNVRVEKQEAVRRSLIERYECYKALIEGKTLVFLLNSNIAEYAGLVVHDAA